jgi:hypothetical protein
MVPCVVDGPRGGSGFHGEPPIDIPAGLPETEHGPPAHRPVPSTSVQENEL